MGTNRKEIRAVLLGLAVVCLYALLVLASGAILPADFAMLLGNYLSAAASLWILTGSIAVLALLLYRRPKGGVDGPSPFAQIWYWLGERWARDRFLSLIWPPLLFALLMASFNIFKQMILPLAGFRFDPLFASMDRMLFLGTDPWRITHSLLGSPWASYAIDKAYHGWFVPMSLGVMICAFLSDESWRARTQYLLSYILIWIGFGSILAFAFPAAGPCFYGHFLGSNPYFDPLMAKLTADQAVLATAMPDAHLSALRNQALLIDAFGSETLRIGGGISAMPSVHNALSVLFAITGFRIHPRLGWAMTLYALLIWIGSIHLGWHYAIDGIFAAALTLWIWHLTGRLADLLARESATAPTSAPLAT